MRIGFLIPVLFLGCSTATPPKTAPASEATASETPAAEQETAASSEKTPPPAASTAESGKIPTTCHKSGPICTPDPAFVKRLCNNTFPSVALVLFNKSMPFTHGYLTRRTEAWNASGGASTSGFVEFDEEVLILVERAANTGGMQVSGANGGYEALRWNGSCVTLGGEEVTLKPPPSAKVTKVDYRFLDDNIQEALRADAAVNAAYLERRNECKGATTGQVTAKCEKADGKLTDKIVDYVRRGGTLPTPKTLP